MRDFLLRRSGMQRDARKQLAQRLAEAVAACYGVRIESDPEAFLEGLGL